jgi:hypothetical protein
MTDLLILTNTPDNFDVSEIHHGASRKLLTRIDTISCNRGVQLGVDFECFVVHLLVGPRPPQREKERRKRILVALRQDHGVYHQSDLHSQAVELELRHLRCRYVVVVVLVLSILLVELL